MACVELSNVSKVFSRRRAASVQAVADLSFTVGSGECLVLMGPSGCGKTTTLRLIAGLEPPTAGEIRLNERSMNAVPPQARDVAMLFQRDALYPHMTVFENMAFGLKLRRVNTPETEKRVREMAEKLGLTPLLQSHPQELSGGQRQRAALGRALVRRPTVLLLDEPLSHLDAPLRRQLRAEIFRLHRELRFTMLYVTHDQHEALAMNHPIALMNHGRLEQLADAATLRQQPANAFVAEFLAD